MIHSLVPFTLHLLISPFPRVVPVPVNPADISTLCVCPVAFTPCLSKLSLFSWLLPACLASLSNPFFFYLTTSLYTVGPWCLPAAVSHCFFLPSSLKFLCPVFLIQLFPLFTVSKRTLLQHSLGLDVVLSQWTEDLESCQFVPCFFFFCFVCCNKRIMNRVCMYVFSVESFFSSVQQLQLHWSEEWSEERSRLIKISSFFSGSCFVGLKN